MERKGTPTVIIASSGFEDSVEASARAFGIPHIQYVVVPDVYNNISEEAAVAQTEPIVDEVTRLLTAGTTVAVPTEEALGGTFEQQLTFVETDYEKAWEKFNTAFLTRDWGDGYPLVPPTAHRTMSLIEAVDGKRDDVICILPPGNGTATVENVSVNAAMAGCQPSDMGVIMAALRAIAKEQSPLTRVALTSTSPCAPLIIVNGPVVREIGLNSGRCCLGPGKQNAVNIRIGRAVLLCLKNIGQWYPGVMDLDTMGSTRKFGMCLAENEGESPWEGFHVSRGFRPEESTVSVTFSNGELDIAFQGDLGPQQLAKSIAACIGGGTNLGYFSTFINGDAPSEEGRLLLLAPPHAQPLARAGFDKEALQLFLYEHVREPVARLIEPFRKLQRDGKIKPEWEWLFELSEEEARITTLPVVERPDLFEIVVAGSVRAKDMVMPTLRLTVTEPVTATPQ